MKNIVSAVRDSIFVAILQEEKNSRKIKRRLLMLVGAQLTLSSLLVLLLILGWPAILKMRWVDAGMPAQQREKEEKRSEVNNRMMPEQEIGDLTPDRPQKSNWMATFDKIRSEIANKIKTTNKMLPPSKVPILLIAR